MMQLQHLECHPKRLHIIEGGLKPKFTLSDAEHELGGVCMIITISADKIAVSHCPSA